MSNPLVDVQKYGQSIWYDNIRRGLITSGELQTLVDRGGVLGVTSNPAIFEKALLGSADYDPAIKALVSQGAGDSKAVYEALAIEDIQWAADVLYPVYARTAGKDGYLSLEVSPHLANDTQGTVQEALRLYAAVGRDNLMIKVPATPEGLPAIRLLISEGISVNTTLIFSVDAYEQVWDAYLSGLEDRAKKGSDLRRVAGVASFFISRIDSSVDAALGHALDETKDAKRRSKLKSLIGKIAVDNARVAYQRFNELRAEKRWQKLEAKGAQVQRVLWASTGTKNPKYSKTLYMDELIGPDTVNTVPTETYHAFGAEGTAANSLVDDGEAKLAESRQRLQTLEELGISLSEVTDQLLEQGLKSFSESFDKLLEAVESKRQSLLGGELAQQAYSLGDAQAHVDEILGQWRSEGNVRRLWNGDASLWSSADEADWLGWLHVVEGQCDHSDELSKIAESAAAENFKHVMLLGMGGSSLCPEVLRKTFGVVKGHPELLVLDSTVPSQVRAFEKQIDPARTLFVVSSKSGGTTESNVLKQYFMEKVVAAVGAEKAGSHFIAVTDPGTSLHKLAKSDRFRTIAHGEPTIGGRYSALSNFGMVPAALMGLDTDEFLERTEIMVQSCAPCVPPEMNPGVTLGVALGYFASKGRDKLTLITSPGLSALGAWLEQLIAESTGKLGKGIIPVDGERVGPPSVYGPDRVFVYGKLNSDDCPNLDAAVGELVGAGLPVIRLSIDDAMDLGQAFFRWEVATATAGAVMGINPFDQPDVESAKIATRELMTSYEKKGTLPSDTPLVEDSDLSLYADTKNAEALRAIGDASNVESMVAAHLARVAEGDYFAIQAFLEMNEEVDEQLQAIRHAVRDVKKVATTLGYGPRFLHSTGQLHKGGPESGVFLQLTSDDAEELPIPGQRYSFSVLKQAQAQGDLQVLSKRGRRVLRINLKDVTKGLTLLREIVESELS